MESLHLYYLGVTVAFAFCVWFIWNEARHLVKHEVLRKEFKASSAFWDVAAIVSAGVVASVLLILAEVFFEYVALEPDGVLYSLTLVMTSVIILITIVSRVHGIFSKLKWAIEMDRLQKLSGVLMTSARSIDGAQSKMFSIYQDNYESQSFTVDDELMVKKLGMLLDQRVTVFYAAPAEGHVPVARFVALNGEAVAERPYIGARYRSKI